LFKKAKALLRLLSFYDEVSHAVGLQAVLLF
jgi:hypothetical protein